LTNYKVTPLFKLFEECRKEARKIGVRVTGSELVGLIPEEALLQTGMYYLEKQGRCPGVSKEELIRTAVLSLGMDQLYPFKPEEKIIEHTIAEKRRLLEMSLTEFSNELSTDSPAPGGGSVAALSGALGSSLSSMVANLTYGKKEYKRYNKQMKELAINAQALKDEFLYLIERDTMEFKNVMSAMRLERKTEEQKKVRKEAIERSTKKATVVPLVMMRKSIELLNLADIGEKRGNQNSVSDAGVAAIMALAACESAYLNVIINLGNIKDEEFSKSTKQEADEILKEVRGRAKRLTRKVTRKLED